MHIKISIFLFFFCSLLVGCNPVPDELRIAERIMETYPDSALCILQHLKPEKYKSSSNHALYGLLYFYAQDKTDNPLEPDSLINFSITYFQWTKDKPHLAVCYFLKARKCKRAQHLDEAAEFYLKALDCLPNHSDNALMGEIYADMGRICTIQHNHQEALKKFRISLDYFNRAGKTLDARFVILSIGRCYYFLRDSKAAKRYYHKALSQMNDSLLCGAVYQDMGVNYYSDKQLDSAQYYLQKSLSYPFKGTNYSIRCRVLADLLFDEAQYDSSFHYATIALTYPATFYNQCDCYRILANIEYTRKRFKEMGIYISHYQDCSDSVHKLESQTKLTVLENIHKTAQEANGTKKNMVLIAIVLLTVLLLSIGLALFLYERNKIRKGQLAAFKQQLNNKQELVSQRLTKKIEEAKALQADERKNATAEERVKLDRELYNKTLHVNNWDDFTTEMNHVFNNIVVTLKSEYPSITNKEITWCCLHLLEIPQVDRLLLLEATTDSLYKLKQRLAHKLNLKTTRDLDLFLRAIASIND